LVKKDNYPPLAVKVINSPHPAFGTPLPLGEGAREEKTLADLLARDLAVPHAIVQNKRRFSAEKVNFNGDKYSRGAVICKAMIAVGGTGRARSLL
jgi:hypothetical protein